MACDCEQTALLQDHREQTVYPFDEEQGDMSAEKPIPIPRRKRKRKLKQCAGRILRNPFVRTLLAACLLIALFGGGCVVVADLPDEPTNTILDIIMSSVGIIFVAEIILRCISESWAYVFSFFFVTDIVGTVSMLFEISFLLGDAGKLASQGGSNSSILVRTARAARIGARAGRLSRSLRCMSFISAPFKKVDPADEGYKAKILGKRLVNTFSSKISMLIIAIVVGIPLFDLGEYPTDDFSMSTWAYKLELDYEHDVKLLSKRGEVDDDDLSFKRSVEEMAAFYERLPYPPYSLDGFPEHVKVDGQTLDIPGASLITGVVPNRLQNVVQEKVSKCAVQRDGCNDEDMAAAYFNFTSTNRYTAIMDMAVILFIIAALIMATVDMTHSIEDLMIAPMEKMLSSAHSMAQQVSAALRRGRPAAPTDGFAMGPTGTLIADDSDDEDVMPDDDNPDEMEELEELFKKVVFIIGVFTEENTVSAPQMEIMDQPTKGVVQEVVGAAPPTPVGAVVQSHRQSEVQMQGCRQSMKIFQSITRSLSSVSNGAQLPVPVDQVDTWSVDFFMMSTEQQIAMATHIVCSTELAQISGNQWGKAETFKAFAGKVHGAYNNNLPFTNFRHGCDTLAACYRLLGLAQWAMWLSDLDAYVMLIASLANDVGHPGRTNAFLIETSHELALRYNDSSPLEHMHCSTLFDIMRESEHVNVFKNLGPKEFKQARSVCIDVILHTDYAQHFKMVKEMKQLYGVNADVIDQQSKNPSDFDSAYTGLLQENSRLFAKVIVHLADISNPLQQFHISQKWATKIMEELFQQGDEEKKLGIPVGMLNDRDKISVPRAQMSFISFLLSPLVLSTLRILPVMYPVSRQMASNAEAWYNQWVDATNPPQEEQAKRKDSLRRIQDQLSGYTGRDAKVGKKSASTDTLASKVKPAAVEKSGANFQGRWTCTATWGLNEFLTACKFSLLRRKAAMSAPWPTWEFQQSGDHIIFINQTAVGELREEFTVNGAPYTTVDGWKQTVKCKASWDKEKLIIERDGPQGKFREERFIDSSGKLQFVLNALQPEVATVKWGRTFSKAS
mmetsp:Transcript_59779/g.142275  ORF Transcript_59779/g.142275 Transcript_59779/m.142275 type:complete len:1068 (-) Transcript_59779:24-3227(-)